MALTAFQQSICQLIAAQRRASGESYVAGGTALNIATHSQRISQDIDLFHDTVSAVEASWEADRRLLQEAGYGIEAIRERSGYVEAVVHGKDERVLVQWTTDSAFRFFPLVEHEMLGLTLHPFDLATNKVLALVGRLEARDWVDVIACDASIQPLGYLVWAAPAKDPGFGPASILEQAGRSARYSSEEVAALTFAGAPPDAAALSREWHRMLEEAREVIGALPPDFPGTCVLNEHDGLFKAGVEALQAGLRENKIRFHQGRIRGALPRVLDAPQELN